MIPKLVLPMTLGAMGLLLALIMVAGLGNGERADYLPVSRQSPGWLCRDWEGHLRTAIMDEWVWKAAADELRGIGEPSLYRPGEMRGTALRTWRLTWLRSFDPPVIVRLTEDRDGPMHLDAVRRAGRGHYTSSTLNADERISRPLAAGEAERLRRIIANSKAFDGSPTECEPRGTDGAEWVLETRGPTGYRMVQAWTPPREAAIRTTSSALLGLTGWNFKGQYERD